MVRKNIIIGLVALLSTLVVAAGASAWNFNGGTVECDGFWKGNIDTGGTTTCSITPPVTGPFSVAVWCINPNDPGNISPPKVAQATFASGSEENQNGRRERGQVNLTISIDTISAVGSSVCNQGNSSPNGNGQWIPLEVLPSSAFIGTVTTQTNQGTSRSEIYSCGEGSLFADGSSMADKIPAITQALIDGTPLSNLNLEYNCTLISETG